MAVSRPEGGLGLMSCVRESSPPDQTDAEDVHHEPKKRRFHPLRGLRRMFRRKERRQTPAPSPATLSADELTPQDIPDDSNQKSLQSGAGLSLSHDSVFNPEKRSLPDSSLSVRRLVVGSTNVQAELVDAVRRRRTRDDTSEDEDLGLPRSPPSGSPTTDTVLKDNVNHSTCSDGSLPSMASSDMDQDSYGHSSGHGSKLSLHDKKNNNCMSESTELEVMSAPLSHSAARHKMSVKPKRNHGAPRKRHVAQEMNVLPSTPEVNEEASTGRSASPDLPPATGAVSAAQLKSASLPPGTAPAWSQSPVKLSRSHSSATNRLLDSITVGEQDETEPVKKEDTTFFGRLLSRRSGKKKKPVEESVLELPQKRMDEKGRYVDEVTKLGRHHPASRQRVEPINIPQDDAVCRMQVFYTPSPTPEVTAPLSLKQDDSHDNKNPTEERLPVRKVIPLEVDSSIPKRTFIKKSQSFRRDEALPFVSLDTPSLPVGLSSDLNKNDDEDENDLNTFDIIDHRLSNETLAEVKETSTTITIHESIEVESGLVTVTEVKPVVELQVRKCACLENVKCESEQSPTNTAFSTNISHQITIPVGTSTVNITQIVSEPHQNIPVHNIKPEPRKKEINKETRSTYPVPAPRPSKRDSLESKPPKVPEFLRVQLNHVDNKPPSNVLLSTADSLEEERLWSESIKENTTQVKEEPASEYVTKNKLPEDTENNDEDVRVSYQNNIEAQEVVCVVKEPVDTNHIVFVNSVKQWSAAPNSITNPNYSIVAMAPKDIKSFPEKNIGSSNENVSKTVLIKEVREKPLPQVDKSQENLTVKPILRQRSFITEDKPTVIVNVDNHANIQCIEDKVSMSPVKKEITMCDLNRSRKLSLEKLDSRNQENMNEFSKRRSREMSSSEDNIVDRNSYGSSDTSQDSGEVILRRKSLSKEIIRHKEEEPELLKVFARRSLKVKDSDVPDDLETLPIKSRDSDKENECGDSPLEERKKIKDHLTESKTVEKCAPSVVAFKYQRSLSSNNEEIVSASVLATSKKDNSTYEKRQRSRTIPDTKIIEPPTVIVATIDRLASVFTEKEVEVISLTRSEDNVSANEENVPKFKRIQQRKEEWEKRAQLALMKNQV